MSFVGFGTIGMDKKKQTLSPQSNIESEIYGKGLLIPKLIWITNVSYKPSCDHWSVVPKGIPVGEDNTFTIKIIPNEVNTDKTKHIILHLQALREVLKDKVFLNVSFVY